MVIYTEVNISSKKPISCQTLGKIAFNAVSLALNVDIYEHLCNKEETREVCLFIYLFMKAFLCVTVELYSGNAIFFAEMCK